MPTVWYPPFAKKPAKDGAPSVAETHAKTKGCRRLGHPPNALLSDIHDRMPVILKGEDHERWLDPGFKQVDDILDLLKPYQADSMRRYRVNPRVNSAQNDDPACAAEYVPEMLF